MYLRTEGIDPKLKIAEDQDLYYKMEEQGSHLYLDEILYRYRIHSNNISLNNNLGKALLWHHRVIESAYKRRRKYYPFINNFGAKEINVKLSNFYLDQMNDVRNKSNLLKWCYLFFKSISVSPRHRIKDKLKAVVRF